MGFFTDPSPRYSRWAARISAACLAINLVVGIASFLPGGWRLDGVGPGFLAVAIVVQLRSVVVPLKLGFRRLDELYRYVPRAYVRAFKVLFLGCVAAAASGFIAARHGQPEIVNGRFVLNNHGSLTVVSTAAYHHAQAGESRIFSLIPAVFFGLSILVNVALMRFAACREPAY